MARRRRGEFMWMYIREKRTGQGDLKHQKPHARERVIENCYKQGITNIRQLNERQSREPELQTTCHYNLGGYLLLRVYETLGEEATSAALREIFLLAQSEGRRVNEEEVYQAFLKSTPPGLEAEFRALYRELHGGS